MADLISEAIKEIQKSLSRHDFKSTITQLSGLLTVPSLQANATRIEAMIRLAIISCKGKRKTRLVDIDRWLSIDLLKTAINNLEDPAEDVFIKNVETPHGNCRILEGLWESSDYYLQVIIDTLAGNDVPQQCKALLSSVFALLKLSDCLAGRLGLSRWHVEQSSPNDRIKLPEETSLARHAKAVIFSNKDLDRLNINRKMLAPFILTNADRNKLPGERAPESCLSRRPLISLGNDIILALPTNITPAITLYLLDSLNKNGYLEAFASAVASLQARQLELEGLRELKKECESLIPPNPNQMNLSISSFLLKYDINKYIHVVLLNDDLRLIVSEGLSSNMELPSHASEELTYYIEMVANYCNNKSDFAGGITLLVMGGLGRGFVLTSKVNISNWVVSVISISNLITLAGDVDWPVSKYLKCVKQINWSNNNGVGLICFNGDYGIYCNWRNLDYQLIPREVPVALGTTILIGSDTVFPVHNKLRTQNDRHVIKTPSDSYARVIRFGRDAFFKSLKLRPIYVSIDHLQKGVLAGVVETSHGASWFIVESQSNNHSNKPLLYEIWNGFISLYERLISEVAALYPKENYDVIAIILSFTGDDLLPDTALVGLNWETSEPEIAVDFDRRVAKIKFPIGFMRHFNQPKDDGERLVMRSMAKGIIGIIKHQYGGDNTAAIENIINNIFGSSNMRVIHAIATHYPMEHLLLSHKLQSVWLAKEDFVFSKLKLSYGCTKYKSGTVIEQKNDCNSFLKNVVSKVWNQLKILLKQFDKTSVIVKALMVNEAAIQDRDQWNLTAQAMISLYSPLDDVRAIAHKRESDRSIISIAARAIIEMAICECPGSGGRQLSRWELDELLAKAALLFEVASDSDAIYNDLIAPRIMLHNNGEYDMDYSFYNKVIKPFVAAHYRDKFDEEASRYEKVYDVEPPAFKGTASKFQADFISAFLSEYGLTPDEAIDGFAELMDYAVEIDNIIIDTTIGYLKSRLTNIRGLSSHAANAFIQTFSLFSRGAWDDPPQGYTDKDIFPWRFRRRLSAVSRPLFAFGHKTTDKVIFGIGTCKLGMSYLISGAEGATLPENFFKSSMMQRYWGAITNQRGHAFEETIALQFQQAGWQVRHSVSMTELGGAKELGDIDVLAWQPCGNVLIVECKRVQLAKTIAEIAEICGKFRGEIKDRLDRHLRRVNWIRSNPSSLYRIVGFTPHASDLDDKLVTNTHVPMKYLASLPIDSCKIGPLSL